jgi:hypothetical protein
LAVPSSGIIDLAIGLVFVFAVAAALSSFVTELITRLIGLRAAYLLSGLRELVDGGTASTDLSQAKEDYKNVQDIIKGRIPPPAGSPPPEPSPAQPSPAEPPAGLRPTPEPLAETAPAKVPSVTGALLSSPILANQGVAGQCMSRKLTLAATTGTGRLPKMTADQTAGHLWKQRRSLPSYISSRSFAEAVIDLVVPDQTGQTRMTAVQQGIKALPEEMSPFKESLGALAKSAEDDIGRFRASVEQWYNDHMDRVSGWYKRHVAKITLVVGAILIVLLNINALTIGRTLYTESAVSTAVSNEAAKATPCTAKESPQECLANLQAQLSAAATAGLPIGWGTVRDCTEPGARCNWLDQRGIFSRHGNSGWQLVLVLIGFLIMVISLVPGARFWFGLLSKLGTLRTTGPKPATARS